MGISRLYTGEMDEVIRSVYAEKGAAETARQLNRDFGKDFSATQIHSRARVLNLTWQGGGGRFNPTTQPRARWSHPKDEPDFVGPNPWIVGIYLVKGYEGYRRKDPLFKGHHYYACRCLKCGKDWSRMQESISRAQRDDIIGCSNCHKLRERRSYKEREAAARKEFEDRKREWLWVLKTMPPTPVEFIPEKMRFDGRSKEKIYI